MLGEFGVSKWTNQKPSGGWASIRFKNNRNTRFTPWCGATEHFLSHFINYNIQAIRLINWMRYEKPSNQNDDGLHQFLEVWGASTRLYFRPFLFQAEP